jgi:glycosyltransferase involved in cell wall biosynthesis
VDRIIESDQKSVQSNGFTVTSVGRLVPIKNPLAVLQAFQQGADQDSRLMFIGDGALRSELQREAEASGMGVQVHLTGLIPRDAVYRELVRTDVFVSASSGEGLPVAPLEAMVCRCPVILSDIPPHREIADGADFVPLVQPGDVAGLAREIERFRQMSPADRAELGRRCREWVEGRFSLASMHRGYEKVYEQVIA